MVRSSIRRSFTSTWSRRALGGVREVVVVQAVLHGRGRSPGESFPERLRGADLERVGFGHEGLEQGQRGLRLFCAENPHRVLHKDRRKERVH